MSIGYYNQQGKAYIDSTFHLSMEDLLEAFTAYLEKGARVLDLGCGSGRDSLVLKDQGYEVYAMDGSSTMVDHARTYLGDRVTLATFQDYEPPRDLDGIWALASLLHVPRLELGSVVNKYVQALKVGGVFFMSFKDRQGDYEKDGRCFTCFGEADLLQFIEALGGVSVEEVIHTLDVRQGRTHEAWVSVIVRRLE